MTLSSPILSQTKPTALPKRRGGNRSQGTRSIRCPCAPSVASGEARGTRDHHCTMALVPFTMAVAGAASSTSASYVPTTKPRKPKRLMAMSLAMTRGCMPSA